MELIIGLVFSVYSYLFMKSVIKHTTQDGPLTKSEKIQVIVCLIFNTLISWIIFHFGWRKTLPIKAAQVNRYGKRILLLLIGIAFLGILSSVLLVVANPNP